jgi:hypothetical protein
MDSDKTAAWLKLRALVDRLRATNDPEAQAVADELECAIEPHPAESLLEEWKRDARRPRGRPTDPPLLRLNKLIEREALSDALYAGELSAGELPPDYEDIANGCKGNRLQADEVAGDLLGKLSARTIRHTRRGWTAADIDVLIDLCGWPLLDDDDTD